MRKALLLLLGVASLATAGAVAGRARSAATAGQTVTISHTGYNPSSVSITVGEAVTFANSDTVAHTVSFKSTTGMSCSPANPLTLQPAQTGSCTFSSAGKYTFSDPVNKGKGFRGTVTVGQSPVSSFTSSPKSLFYGRKVTLAGTLASQQSGQSVQVVAQVCGSTASTTLATLTTGAGGVFTYAAQPLKQTAYTVKSKNLSSGALTVKVLPHLGLRKIARHRYRVLVSASDSFAGKSATFQRYRSSTKRWVKVKLVALKANSTGKAPTIITSATFRSSIKSRVKVRVTLGQKQVGSCYTASRSNTIRS
jgi:plastocyanin